MEKKAKDRSSFPNPTIIEAICEFHFMDKDGSQISWDGKWFGRLHSMLGEEYDMEPKIAQGVIVQPTNQGKSILSENSILMNQMLYKHITKNRLIQLSPWLLAINEIGKYPGWNSFLEHIKLAWHALASIIDGIQLKRIGMRYINRIPRISDNPVCDWLHNDDLFPKRILNQRKDFFLRCEIPEKDDIRTIITLTEEQIKNEIKPIIFDIETFMITNKESNWLKIKNFLYSLHNIIRNEFDNSLTNRLKEYLTQLPEEM